MTKSAGPPARRHARPAGAISTAVPAILNMCSPFAVCTMQLNMFICTKCNYVVKYSVNLLNTDVRDVYCTM